MEKSLYRAAPSREQSADAGSPDDDVVSVVIPAYNAAGTIAATLASVSAQTYPDLEIVVVDDGSTDGTAALVQSLLLADPRIRLRQKANGGPAAARNLGIAHSRGGLIASLDADDIWHPTMIEKMVAAMRQHGRKIGAVYCWSRAVDGEGRIYFDYPRSFFRGDVFAPLIVWNFVHTGALLVRRQHVADIGGYDVTLPARGARLCEDLKFNLDLAERCDFAVVPEYLFAYTMRAGSASRNTAVMNRSRSIVIAEARAKHPELPVWLFRWAAASAAVNCSRVYFKEGLVWRGLRELARAAATDPLVVLRSGTDRLLGEFLGPLGFKEMLRNRVIGGPSRQRSDVSPKLVFVRTDPVKPYPPERSSWFSKRLRHAGRLRIARMEQAKVSEGCPRERRRALQHRRLSAEAAILTGD